MKIRQKLLLTYLGLASAALFLVSTWVYVSQAHALRTQVLQQLDAIAEIQKRRLQHMLAQNRERLGLVTSRTQLRLSLRSYLNKNNPQHIQKVKRIISDAKKSVTDFKTISVTDTSGKVIVSTDPRLQEQHVYSETLLDKARKYPNIDTLERRDDGEVYLLLSAPLILDGQTIGLIVIETDIQSITSLTTDYTGLGESGETVLAARLSEDEIIFITPLRFDPDAALRRTVSVHDAQWPIVQAMQQFRLRTAELSDYRQVQVLASSRYIESVKWGVVVKIDQQEALAPIEELRISLILISIIVLLLIVIFSYLLASRITRPLYSLSHAAKRIAAGDYSQSVDINSGDEIGALARVFNRMMTTLEDARSKIDSQFNQLSNEIHERKQAEKKLTEYQDQLESQVIERTAALSASNDELKSFSYTVTHDLRAPLRSIDGFSQALREDCSEQLDETGKEYVKRIHKTVHRMSALIDDILRLSSVSRDDMVRRNIHISEMARIIVETHQHNEPTRETEIHIEDNIHVDGDRELVRIVLENLIGNAWKYSSKKPLSKINIYHTVSHDGIDTVCIRDNGSGFDMAKSIKLFTPFQRYHSREFEGNGIGLATVQRIIERHEGVVWADAEPDKGATFCFTLSSSNKIPLEKPQKSDRSNNSVIEKTNPFKKQTG